ncbi:MAG: hypothetical protein QXK94_04490 [Candidatus Jordarchaeales archaeon]
MGSKRDNRMFAASMILLVGEIIVLITSLVVPWKVNVIPYIGGVIFQQIKGISTDVFFYGVTPPDPLWIIAVYGSVWTPLTWPLVPLCIGAKVIFLSRAKFNECVAADFACLIYLLERYVSFQYYSSLPQITSSLVHGIFPHGGVGVYSFLLGLLLGLFSTNYFFSSILNPAIVEVLNRVRSKGEASLEELASEMRIPKKLLYELLSRTAVQGVLTIVVTTEKVYPINSDEGRKVIVSFFSKALSAKGKVNMNRMKKLMKKNNIWFKASRKVVQEILQEAIEKGEIKAVVNGAWIKSVSS